MQKRVAALLGASALAFASGFIVHSSPPHRARSRPEAENDRIQYVHRATSAQLAVRNRVALAESIKVRERTEAYRKLRARNPKAVSAAATEWVSLGPTDAPKEFNYFIIAGVDSGRPNTILVDPRDGNV